MAMRLFLAHQILPAYSMLIEGVELKHPQMFAISVSESVIVSSCYSNPGLLFN